MPQYDNILLALELDPATDQPIVKKAQELVEQFNGTLTLVHAIEHLSNYGAAYGVSAGIDIEKELTNEAMESMKKTAKTLNLPDDRMVVKVGPAKLVVLEEAKKRLCNLVIVGSHGRHGVQLLLGSTANAVLHGAQCDVLAVRVK